MFSVLLSQTTDHLLLQLFIHHSPNYLFWCFELASLTLNNVVSERRQSGHPGFSLNTSTTNVNNTSPFVSAPLTGLSLSRVHSHENSTPPVRCVFCPVPWNRRLEAHLLPLVLRYYVSGTCPPPISSCCHCRRAARRCQDALESIFFSHFNYSWG